RDEALRDDPEAWREAAVTSLTRAAVAVGGKVFESRSATDIMRDRAWTDDRVASLITRAASAPAMTSTTGWAAELGQVALAFLRTLTPMSAAAALLDQCLTLSFNGAEKISLPNIKPGTATFVKQGDPIRVLQMPTLVSQSLLPCKLAAIVELTREMMESSN